ncbi:2,3-bisphosphoglycerate-independent phosphoglycerate mutase [soil metagenome]
MTVPPGPAWAPVPSVALVVLDGWGLAADGPGNAVSQAATPVFDELWSAYPNTTLSTSGADVGLPAGQMGNSEVGHLNLGAGAVVKQDLARIDDAILDGSFFDNPALRDVCGRARDSRRGRLHAIALVSDGGVHSGWSHIEAMIELAAEEGVYDLVLHVLTDGRDTLPASAAGYVGEVERWLVHAGRIGTVGGRYWGMDRDERWERTGIAYDAIVRAQGESAESAGAAIRNAYAAGVTDEFIAPTVVGGYDGIVADEPVVFVNFRPDRARQLTRALGEPAFTDFDRGGPLLEVTTMTSYREGWDYPVAFSPSEPDTTIAEMVAETGGRQLHVAETEKYAHVTYFFNGGREQEWGGEERALVPSPRDVPTYDHKPEMNAAGASREFTSRWREEPGFRFGVINFANPDMVGHTGVIPAAVAAIEEVDGRLAEVVAAVHESGGACIVTADHGNAEQMLEPDGSPNTAHSTNPVPAIVTASGIALRNGGILADVAPTALALLGIGQPEAMTGRSLREP